MGTHLRVHSESLPINTNMTGLRWFSKNICILVHRAKVAFALEELGGKGCVIAKHCASDVVTANAYLRPCPYGNRNGKMGRVYF